MSPRSPILFASQRSQQAAWESFTPDAVVVSIEMSTVTRLTSTHRRGAGSASFGAVGERAACIGLLILNSGTIADQIIWLGRLYLLVSSWRPVAVVATVLPVVMATLRVKATAVRKGR